MSLAIQSLPICFIASAKRFGRRGQFPSSVPPPHKSIFPALKTPAPTAPSPRHPHDPSPPGSAGRLAAGPLGLVQRPKNHHCRGASPPNHCFGLCSGAPNVGPNFFEAPNVDRCHTNRPLANSAPNSAARNTFSRNEFGTIFGTARISDTPQRNSGALPGTPTKKIGNFSARAPPQNSGVFWGHENYKFRPLCGPPRVARISPELFNIV